MCQVLALWPAGRIADRVGRRPLMLGGPALGITGATLLAVSESVPAFLVAMACFGGAAAAMGIAPSAVVGDVVGGRGGTVIAAYGMAADVGTVIGPLVSGALAETSFGAAFATTAAVLAVGLVMSLRMPETVASRLPAAAVADALGWGRGPAAHRPPHAVTRPALDVRGGDGGRHRPADQRRRGRGPAGA